MRPLSRLQEIERKINDLVRLALFSEYRRVPIRRDDISKKGEKYIRNGRMSIILTFASLDSLL